VVAGWAIVLGVTIAYAGDAPSPAVREPGMRAYADPRTGTLLSEPPARATAPAAAAFSRSSAGLAPVPAPGGGVMIDLQGRFQSPLVATVGPDGTVHLHHGAPTE
jgi:hypothetical protein